MVKRLLEGPWEHIQQRFPDRQIYHRTEGQVRYFVVTTAMQLSVIGAVCVLAVWLTITSVNMIMANSETNRMRNVVAEIEDEHAEALSEARAAEEAALAYVESRTNAFDSAAGQFQMRHDTLRRLLDFADDLSVGEERASPGLDDGRILMAAMPADPDPRTALYDADGPTDIDGLAEERVTALLSDQDAALAAAEDSAERRLENLRAVLRLTGMQVDEAMEEGPLETEGGTGGPMIPLIRAPLFADALNLDDPFNARVARIASRLAEAEQLEMMLEAAPLAIPVDGPYRRTSPYGSRRDPFNQRWAFHAGSDFAAFRNAPIVAPAPGRVVYAGWRAGYGRTVEVDHGFGYRTRFAHLHSIDVRRGDAVETGQRLGGMGSTGRSTGTHLHYEVWFRGEHVDPESFIRAGRYVH